MTLRHRRALWFGDPSKQEKLSAILRDPVLAEAIELHLATVRSQYPDTRDTTPDLLLARRSIEQGGVEHLIQSLDLFTRPVTEAENQNFLSEWEHLEQTNIVPQ